MGFGIVPGSKVQWYKEVEFDLFYFFPFSLSHLSGEIRSITDLQGKGGEGSNVSAADKATALRDTAMSCPAREEERARAGTRAAPGGSGRSGPASTTPRLQAK